MKKLLALFVGLYLTLSVSAQFPMGGAAAGNRQAPPSIGRVYGKLVDSTGKGIRDATVLILQNHMDTATKKMKEVLLKGVTSQGNGDFNLEGLPIFGPLKLTISAVGFQPVTQTVRFEIKMPPGGAPAVRTQQGQMPDLSAIAGNFEKDLGNITLVTDAKALQGIVVTATSTRMRMDIDKKVFNVAQNLVSAGGTAVDVMKNVPSVNVDIDGNVTLRNATPQIYIDGRPTTLTLDQIPADAIESVEVITNPSAKYDASGGNAGILNIVLKKNKRTGYNGTINAGVDKRGGVNGGTSLSVRTNKINVSVAGFGNQMRNRNTTSTNLQSLLTSPNLIVDQNGRTNMRGGFLFGRGGLDYFVTNRTTLSLSYTKVHGEFNPADLLRTDSSLSNGQYLSYSERNTKNHREFNAHGFTGGFKYSFPKKGEEWTGDFNIFSGRNNSNSLYNTNVYNYYGGPQKGNIQQQIIGSGTNQFTTMQTDYVNPLGATAKLELGARVQLRKMSNSLGNYFMNNLGEFMPIPASSSNYKNNEHVYAAYVNFSNSVKNFGYQVGLRGERSDYTGELTESKETFTNKYPLSLFPSVFLSQKLNKQQEVQLSYTRRINRPFFMQIIPFIDSSDVTNLTRGNPGLRPEFTNSLEMSYSKTYKGNNTFLASVYYKYSTDLITRYLDTVTIGYEKRPVSTFVNANSSRSVGFELTSQNTVTKWWDMNANFNLYNSKINTSNIANGSTQQNPLWSYFAKMNSNFKLPKKFKIQLSGTYQSKTNLPVNQGGGGFGGGPPMGTGPSAAQGYIKSNWGVDFALQRSFLKNDAASITLNVSDIFRTRRFDQYSASTFFIQNTHRLGDVPMFRLNFSYRFGQMDLNVFKRKNTKVDQESQQGAMQNIGQ
jgi:outer membrane receptor protein involved in Fe transport